MIRLLDYDFALWLVAAALYAFDVVRAVPPSQMLLVEGRRGAWRATLSRVPFEWGTRHVVLSGLLAPWAGALTAVRSAASTELSPSRLSAELARLDAMRARLLPLRATATAVFVLLFVAGPLITWRGGVTAAVILAIAPAYVVALAAGTVLLLRAPALGLTRGRASWIAAETLVCIPLAANAVKKVMALWVTDVDGVALARARASAAEREELDAQLAALRELEQGDAT